MLNGVVLWCGVGIGVLGCMFGWLLFMCNVVLVMKFVVFESRYMIVDDIFVLVVKCLSGIVDGML